MDCSDGEGTPAGREPPRGGCKARAGVPLTIHGGAGLVHQPVALQDAVGELRGLPGHVYRGGGQLAELDRAGSTGGCGGDSTGFFPSSPRLSKPHSAPRSQQGWGPGRQKRAGL